MYCGINYKHIRIHRPDFTISRLFMLNLILTYRSFINYEGLCDSKKSLGRNRVLKFRIGHTVINMLVKHLIIRNSLFIWFHYNRLYRNKR